MPHPDVPYSRELATAESAGREAGAIIMGLFKGKYDVQEKSRNNPVTTADLAANARIRDIVLSTFPNDAWLSEEDKDSSRRLESSRVWVVDPIDGTKEFIEGVPEFAVSIALVVDGHPTVGVVYNPAEEKFYSGAAGQGASLNGRPIRVGARDDIHGALLLVSRSEPRQKFQVFVDRCKIRSVGSIANRLAQVAGGNGDGTLTFRTIHEWDICAGMLLVEAAGGKVVDGAGNKPVFNRPETRHRGVVAANRPLADDLQTLWAAAMGENGGPK
jgi:myo-inositol-1(or 4)-monophosphatase